MRLVPSKVFNPREHVEADTYVNADAYVGAFHDMECRTTSKDNFKTPIYFQPALVQPRKICRPDLDDDDVENIVGIPIITNRSIQWDSNLATYRNRYNLQVDLYRPKPTLDLGGQYKSVEGHDNLDQLLLGPDDDVNVGDTIFIYSDNLEIFEVEYVDYDDDNKIVTLDSKRSDGTIQYAGWIMPSDDPDEDANTLLRQIISQNHLQSPIFGGICGPLQPITVDTILLHFMVLISGNAKIVVDDEFYDYEWLSGDNIEMRLFKTAHRIEDQEDVLDTYLLRYRHPSQEEKDENFIWRCIIGQFIIEGDQPFEKAAYITVSAPNYGYSTTSI